MGIAQQIQYATIALYVAKLPGNKFYNGILFGVAEVFSMFFSNHLMQECSDISVFNILCSFGAVSYAILLLFPFEGLHIYIANFLLVSCAGGWFNVW